MASIGEGTQGFACRRRSRNPKWQGRASPRPKPWLPPPVFTIRGGSSPPEADRPTQVAAVGFRTRRSASLPFWVSCVPFRVLIEGFLAAGATEIECVPAIFSPVLCCYGINDHAAHRISGLGDGRDDGSLPFPGNDWFGLSYLDDLDQDTDRDFFLRYSTEIQAGRSSDPAEQLWGDPLPAQGVKDLAGFCPAGNKGYVRFARAQGLLKRFFIVFSLGGNYDVAFRSQFHLAEIQFPVDAIRVGKGRRSRSDGGNGVVNRFSQLGQGSRHQGAADDQ